MVKVQLPRVEEDIRSDLNTIKAQRKDKTLSETLRELIQNSNELDEAKQKIDSLEEENKYLKNRIFELSSDLTNIKLGRSTLSEFKENMEKGDLENVKCTVRLKDENKELENGK